MKHEHVEEEKKSIFPAVAMGIGVVTAVSVITVIGVGCLIGKRISHCKMAKHRKEHHAELTAE